MFRELLEELLRNTGAQYCCVADAALGKVIEESGVEATGERASLAVLGWTATAAAYLVTAAADDLDDLIVTSRHTHHLVRQVGSGTARPLLLYLRLDRKRGTLAAARRELAAVRLDRPRPAPAPPSLIRVVAGQGESPDVPARAPAQAAAPPVAVPLPRRRASPPPVQRRVPEPAAATTPRAGGPAPAGGRWNTDPATLLRLLRGLRDLR